MSDTSIISTVSSYDNHRTKKMDGNENSSCCARYWCKITSSFLLIIIIITSVLLMHVLQKQAERDRERHRIKNEFKRKHGVANKVLDMITKDGFIYKLVQKMKGPMTKVFKELFEDISETLFDG